MKSDFGTDQLLLTGPTSLWSIVMGKFLAAFAVFFITIIVTVLYPVLLSFHGTLDWPMIVGTYVGFVLLGASFIAIGVFISQAAEGVVGAAVLTFCALIITFIIDFLRPYMPTSDVAGLVWTIIMMMIPIFWLFRAGKKHSDYRSDCSDPGGGSGRTVVHRTRSVYGPYWKNSRMAVPHPAFFILLHRHTSLRRHSLLPQLYGILPVPDGTGSGKAAMAIGIQ
jgi:hypothetical protein